MEYIHKFDAWFLSIGILIAFIALKEFFAKYLIHKLRDFAKLTHSTFDDELIDAFEYPMRFAIIGAGIYFAILYSPTAAAQADWVHSFMRSIVIITFFRGMYNISDTNEGIFNTVIQKTKYEIDPAILSLLSKFLRFLVVVLGFAVVAKEWGYDINGFVTGLGIGGLAFALAAKDTLANIFASMVIVIDKPFSVGDWIQTNNVEGVVESISFRSVGVRTFDQALVYVPSALLAGTAITNFARMGKRRARFFVGVTYDANRAQLEKIGYDINSYLKTHSKIITDETLVRFDNFGDSSLNILVQFYTTVTDMQNYYSIKEEVNFAIMDIVAENGLEIAFPTRTVYLVNPDTDTTTAATISNTDNNVNANANGNSNTNAGNTASNSAADTTSK